MKLETVMLLHSIYYQGELGVVLKNGEVKHVVNMDVADGHLVYYIDNYFPVYFYYYHNKYDLIINSNSIIKMPEWFKVKNFVKIDFKFIKRNNAKELYQG